MIATYVPGRKEMNLLNEETIIKSEIIRGITEVGFEKLTPIQEQAIPVLLQGEDIIGQAQTGTGKTAAFGIPLIQKIDPEDGNVQGLVLCPTRELAIQAAEELRKFSKYLHGVKIVPIYGGADIGRQIKSLRGNVSIVVGTPGRVMDHMRRHTLKLGSLKMLVLDEADEMLNMGFRDDIETILKEIPGEHQTALFSATMPKGILEITKNYLKPDAAHIKVAAKELTVSLIKQYYYEVNSYNKDDVVVRLLDYYNPKRSLIFCNTKTMVDSLGEFLKKKGYMAEGLHGDLSQAQRDKVMNGFRNGATRILIATDVAARGIDVNDVEAVINYDLPQDIEYYVHRIGRTGRAGREGHAFSLVVGRDRYRIRDIERACKTKMEEKEVPSSLDVLLAKTEQVFEDIAKTLSEENLGKQMVLIQEKLQNSDVSAEELAAALLKMQMGKDPEEIIIDKYVPRRSGRYGYDDRRSGGRGSYGRDNGSYGRGNARGDRNSSRRSSDGQRSGYGKSYATSRYDKSYDRKKSDFKAGTNNKVFRKTVADTKRNTTGRKRVAKKDSNE